MRQARFEHLHAGVAQAGGEFAAQRLGDLVGVATQAHARAVVLVVGVLAGEVPQRRLALDGDELGVVLDVEHGAGAVHDPPDDHGGDLDGAPGGVVHLQAFAVEVADPQADALSHRQGLVQYRPLRRSVPT